MQSRLWKRMGPSAVCGLQFIDWRAATHGAGPVTIRCHQSQTQRSSDARDAMTKRGEKMQAEILALLRRTGGALSAYDVLHELQASHPKIAPPTVYNALAALTKTGRVHRVESLKAYVACKCDESHRSSLLSICDECGTVEERVAPKLVNDISGLVEETGFQPQRHVIEVHGMCSACDTNDTST